MAINVYINFNGNTKDAVNFYAKVFKSEIPEMMTYASGPQDPNFQLPPEAENLIMHANLKVYDSNIMFADSFPGMTYTLGNHMSVMVGLSDLDEIRRAFDELSVGGQILMPLQETFWSKCYGQVQDQFGIAWQFNHE